MSTFILQHPAHRVMKARAAETEMIRRPAGSFPAGHCRRSGEVESRLECAADLDKSLVMK
jgi:hypothetical protein